MSQAPNSLPPGEAEYRIAARLYQEGKLIEAEKVLRQGITANPEHPWCNSLLGVILSDRNLLDEAGNHLRNAVEAPSCDYTDPGIVRNFAIFLLEKRQDPKQAKKILYTALDKRKHSQIYAVLGWVLEKQEQWRDARAQYLEAIYRPPEPSKEGKWGDKNLGYWYAVAVSGFERTSAKYRGVQKVKAPLSWRIGSILFIVLFLAGTISLPESITSRLDWLPILQWSEATQIALIIVAVSLWVFPFLLPYCKRLKVGPVEIELLPRMGPQ